MCIEGAEIKKHTHSQLERKKSWNQPQIGNRCGDFELQQKYSKTYANSSRLFQTNVDADSLCTEAIEYNTIKTWNVKLMTISSYTKYSHLLRKCVGKLNEERTELETNLS